MSRLRKNVEGLSLSRKKSKDYDPEDEPSSEQGESASGSEQDIALEGREHYENVGKSKLRKPVAAPLDRKYGGAVISRTALDEDESDQDPFAEDDVDDNDDPFAQPGNREEDAADASDPGDNAHGIEAQALSEDDDEDEDVMSNGPEEEQEGLSEDDQEDEDRLSDIDEDQDEEEDEDERADRAPVRIANGTGKREELKALLSNQAQSLASGLSRAASADVNKGRAVKRQYQTFDRLLDSRMKLQKGLASSEELVAEQHGNTFDDADAALKQAEEAALNLFNTISDFRDSIADAEHAESATKRRKTTPVYTSSDRLDSIWKSLNTLELEAQPLRRKTIDKWSNKVKASDPTHMAASSKSKFLDSSSQSDRLTAILDTYVINEQEKYFRPSQTNGDPQIDLMPSYDDSLFYQSLLRELINTRAATSNAANISASILPPKLHPSGNKENRKTVDTKVSKGRKIRYTVHEKLQNFMAAEGDTGRDTAMWTERGKNEFFGSLFGQDRALDEREDDGDLKDGGGDGEFEALRLFRS